MKLDGLAKLSPPFLAENYQVCYFGLISEIWLPAALQFTRKLHTFFTKCWSVVKTSQITWLCLQLAASAVFSFLWNPEHLLDFQGKVLKVPVLCLLPAFVVLCSCIRFRNAVLSSLKSSPYLFLAPCGTQALTWCWESAPACVSWLDISLYIIACTSVYSLTGVSFCLYTFALSHYLVWRLLTISLAELCLPPRLWTPQIISGS